MAIVIPSELFSSIRGSIGGTTFSQSRAGLIAKRRTVGKKNYTTKQANVIKIQSYVTGQWQNLSLENQLLWNDYANLYELTDRFGTVKQLSGFNWFVHMNNLKYAYDSTILESPPITESALPVPQFSVDVFPDSIELNFDDPVTSSDELFYVFATLPNQLTSTTNRGKLRLIKVVDEPDFSLLDITADYENYFNVVWSDLTQNSNFNIQVCCYRVNKLSWLNSVQLCGVGRTGIDVTVSRITEASEIRITEDGDIRITEE